MTAKELSLEIKQAIVRAKERGQSCREVAALFNVGKSVVSNIYKRHRESNTVANRRRSGRPRKSTKRDDKVLARIVKKDPKKTATDVAKYANEHLKLGITTRTARNILK